MVLGLLVMMTASSAFVGVDGTDGRDGWMDGISCDGWFGNGHERWKDGRTVAVAGSEILNNNEVSG